MSFPDRAAKTKAKKALAKALKVSIKRVNRMKLCEKPLESVQKREKKARKAAEHREKCLKMAEKVVNREITRKNAAIACKISERQMARYVAKYLKESEL